MNIEEIEHFLDTKTSVSQNYVKIDFKKRNPIYGLFIKDRDYVDLKSKNFWRIVSEANFEQWKQSKDYNLCRMFNGSEFTKLALN